MTNGTPSLLPVITGLAIGIGFVALFSIFFTPSPSLSENNSGRSAALIEQVIESSGAPIIDFTVTLSERDILVKKVGAVKVPVTIESFESVEKVLSLSVMPRSNVPDSSQFALSSDYESLVLSEDNIAQGKARINDFGG